MNRNFSILSKLYQNRKKTRKTNSIKTDFDFSSENFDLINFDFDYRKFFNLDHVWSRLFSKAWANSLVSGFAVGVCLGGGALGFGLGPTSGSGSLGHLCFSVGGLRGGK